MDLQKIQDFWQARTKVEDPRLATNYRNDGRLQIDVNFITERLTPDARILDLGAGTCTLAQELLPMASRIIAVDKFEGFLNRAPIDAKLDTVCGDAATFLIDMQFDAILLFGVVNFLTVEAEETLYQNCASMLADDGVFIVKNQCGIEREIIVDKFSEELQCNYHARYPFVDNQFTSLSQHFVTQQFDIYPNHINRWADTHFYAFECRK
ncbi:Methyltransferase domain protein [Pirellula sp. SH-Sr6A]|uniref:class I SAM-dependent methyltransferase n=1 Tax=Pirellula sp. SH-Sr6A TaxID=1632865 RepID=UPI00078EAE73|nr:class I SAM-dependent methyltransferase [Pirellula sp. SH-Sr6A]AMV31368.1 Methyltransferase domain protein [Pirellula sp. SH-Sr6A]